MATLEKLGKLGLSIATKNYVAAAIQVVGELEDFATEAQSKRVHRWWKGLIEDNGWETPQEVQGRIEARLKESSKAKEVVWAAAKEILDAISEESAEVIGSLTADSAHREHRDRGIVIARIGDGDHPTRSEATCSGGRAGFLVA